jgi:hypothetical protein
MFGFSSKRRFLHPWRLIRPLQMCCFSSKRRFLHPWRLTRPLQMCCFSSKRRLFSIFGDSPGRRRGTLRASL